MKALLSTQSENKISTSLTDLPHPPVGPGQVLVATDFSSINYKDALAITGRGAIFKSLPLIGGIDVSGKVTESNDSRFHIGQEVLVTGCGLGETHNGGYAEFVVEDAENVIPLPSGLTTQDAMIYGTAGFTAALCVERLLQNGQTPDKGPILVTGASGGVGQFAVYFFSQLGFQVHAYTQKVAAQARLKAIGAEAVIHELPLSSRLLDKVLYGGAVDNVGGRVLAGTIPHVNLWGNIACVGLAESADLKTTVMPMILRGVSLIGISSNNTPKDLRHKIWQRLATDLKPNNLDSYISQIIGLKDVVSTAESLLARKISGRTLVKIA